MNTVTRRALILVPAALRAVAVSVAFIASVGCGEQSEPAKQARPSATTAARSDPPRLAGNGRSLSRVGTAALALSGGN